MEKVKGQFLVNGGGLVVCGFQEEKNWKITIFRKHVIKTYMDMLADVR